MPGIGRCRQQPEPAADRGVQSHAVSFDRTLDRELVGHQARPGFPMHFGGPSAAIIALCNQ